MRYLYFKDGILKLNAKVDSEELVAQFGTPVVVEDTFVTETPTGEVSDGIAGSREKTRFEIEGELTYSTKRAAAYPSLTEQADMAYWDRQHGTTTLDDAINAVKIQFPK